MVKHIRARVIPAPWCNRQRRPSTVSRDVLPHFHVIVGTSAYCARGAIGVREIMRRIA